MALIYLETELTRVIKKHLNLKVPLIRRALCASIIIQMKSALIILSVLILPLVL
jgi:hypothetical protein